MDKTGALLSFGLAQIFHRPHIHRRYSVTKRVREPRLAAFVSAGYRGRALAALTRAGAAISDTIEISCAEHVMRGSLMPRAESEWDEIVTLKLANGYNVGVSVEGCSVRVVTKYPHSEESLTEDTLNQSSASGPRVSLISTGGTIASRVEYETGAVKPALEARDLLDLVPELHDVASVETKVLMSILSEDMKPNYWTTIAESVYSEILKAPRGVVVAHGTDTMGYTSAALSFALEGLGIPVVFVGSQRSSDRPSSDSYLNLLSAVNFAKDANAAGVFVCMHGTPSDSDCYVTSGVRTRKMHTSSRAAFRPVNDGLVAKASPNKIEMCGDFSARSGGIPKLKPQFSDRAALLYSFPGLKEELLEAVFNSGVDGVVIAGTGLGHVSSELVSKLGKLTSDGKLVFMTSQCLFGRVNMDVYTTGRRLQSVGVIPLDDMLPETAYVKLSWCLANLPKENIGKAMRQNMAGEIGSRSTWVAEGSYV